VFYKFWIVSIFSTTKDMFAISAYKQNDKQTYLFQQSVTISLLPFYILFCRSSGTIYSLYWSVILWILNTKLINKLIMHMYCGTRGMRTGIPTSRISMHRDPNIHFYAQGTQHNKYCAHALPQEAHQKKMQISFHFII